MPVRLRRRLIGRVLGGPPGGLAAIYQKREGEGASMSTPSEQDEHETRGPEPSVVSWVNERINAIKETRAVWVSISEWVCECADETCTERIDMSPEEYEELPGSFRGRSRRDACVFGGRVGCREAREIGEAAEVAEQLDNR